MRHQRHLNLGRSLATCIMAGSLAAGALTASPVRAELVGANDPAFGTGDDGFNLTRDTATRLEWLDLTLSTNLSYDDVAGGAGGFLAAGFSIATGAQVDQLFVNSGATDLFDTPLASQFTSAQNLIGLLGCTVFCGTGTDVSQGAAEIVPFSATQITVPFVRIFEGEGIYDGSFNCCADKDLSAPSFGIFLVRAFAENASCVSVLASFFSDEGLDDEVAMFRALADDAEVPLGRLFGLLARANGTVEECLAIVDGT